MAANLINDITITIIPIILGKGKSLFGDLEKDILLKLIDTKVYEFGFIQLTYKVLKWRNKLHSETGKSAS